MRQKTTSDLQKQHRAVSTYWLAHNIKVLIVGRAVLAALCHWFESSLSPDLFLFSGSFAIS